jgi:hypothetical protein
MKTTFLPKALGFTESDLKANAEGLVSGRQQRAIRVKTVKRSGDVLLLGGCLIFLFIPLFIAVLNRPPQLVCMRSEYGDETCYDGNLLVGAGVMMASLISAVGLKKIIGALKEVGDPKPSSIEGALTVSTHDDHEHVPSYSLHISEKLFSLAKQQYEGLLPFHEKPVRLYYWRDHILSVEDTEGEKPDANHGVPT